MKGYAFITTAREALANGLAPPRDRLLSAAKMFWRAMFYEEFWPESLRVRAAAVALRFLAHGPIARTVAALDDAEVDGLLDDLSRLIHDFDPAIRDRAADRAGPASIAYSPIE